MQARDLHLIDGRIFRGIQPPKIVDGELRIVHDAGFATVTANSLSRADYYEFGLHLKHFNSNTFASSSATTTGALGFNSSATSNGSSYSGRSYSNRDYSERQYNPDYTSSTTVPAEPTPPPSYTSPTRYTRPPDTSSKTVHVRGYYTKKGTYVQPHSRRSPR